MADYDEKEDLMDRLLAIGQAKEIFEPRRAPSRDSREHDVRRRSRGRSRPSGGRKYFGRRDRRQLLEAGLELALTMRKRKKSKRTISTSIFRPALWINPTTRSGFIFAKWVSFRFLNREGEVAIAKRIERGQIKTHKAISRSPIAVERLIKIGEDLASRQGEHSRNGRVFASRPRSRSKKTRPRNTCDGRSRASRISAALLRAALKTWIALRQQSRKKPEGKKSKKLLTLRRQTARMPARDRPGDQKPQSDRACHAGIDRRDPQGRRGDPEGRERADQHGRRTSSTKNRRRPRKRSSTPRSPRPTRRSDRDRGEISSAGRSRSSVRTRRSASASPKPIRQSASWSRPTFVWSFRSPRNTRIAACSSSISSRKATSV